MEFPTNAIAGLVMSRCRRQSSYYWSWISLETESLPRSWSCLMDVTIKLMGTQPLSCLVSLVFVTTGFTTKTCHDWHTVTMLSSTHQFALSLAMDSRWIHRNSLRHSTSTKADTTQPTYTYQKMPVPANSNLPNPLACNPPSSNQPQLASSTWNDDNNTQNAAAAQLSNDQTSSRRSSGSEGVRENNGKGKVPSWKEGQNKQISKRVWVYFKGTNQSWLKRMQAKRILQSSKGAKIKSLIVESIYQSIHRFTSILNLLSSHGRNRSQIRTIQNLIIAFL